MNASEYPPNLDIVMDVPVSLTAELGSCQLPMRDIFQLGPGSVVQLDKSPGATVELRANHKLVARGEVVVIENRLAIRITELAGSTVEPAAARIAQTV
jgi:flagellar motor switch protein FliN/FliY